MDDALGNTGRARRIEDVERVIEREWLEERAVAGRCGHEFVPADDIADRGDSSAAEVRNEDRPLHRRQRTHDLGDPSRAVMVFPGVRVGVGRDENLWLDLAESIENALRAEVRRTGRPHGAHRRRSERRDDRFGQVRDISRNPVARPDALAAKRRRKCGDCAVELGAGHRADRPIFSLEDDGDAVASVRQQVVGEVQRGIWEERRAGHPIQIGDNTRSHRAAHAGEVPHQPPEIFWP